MKKRWIPALLALCLALQLFPVGIFAVGEEETGAPVQQNLEPQSVPSTGFFTSATERTEETYVTGNILCHNYQKTFYYWNTEEISSVQRVSGAYTVTVKVHDTNKKVVELTYGGSGADWSGTVTFDMFDAEGLKLGETVTAVLCASDPGVYMTNVWRWKEDLWLIRDRPTFFNAIAEVDFDRYVSFFYCDGKSMIPLNPVSVVPETSNIVKVLKEKDIDHNGGKYHSYHISVLEAGITKLLITVDGQSEPYEVPVNTTIPASGFFKDPAVLDKTSFITPKKGFTFESLEDCFYYVSDEELSAVQVTSYGDYVHAALTNDSKIVKITFTDAAAGVDYSAPVDLQLTYAAGGNGFANTTIYYGIKGLMLMYFNGTVETTHESCDIYLKNFFTGDEFMFYWGNTVDAQPISPKEVRVDGPQVFEFLKTRQIVHKGEKIWVYKFIRKYDPDFAERDPSLVVTLENDEEFTIPFYPYTPDGFYITQQKDSKTWMMSVELNLLPDGKTVWYLTKDGLTKDEADTATGTGCDVEAVLRPGTTDRYDLKCTLKYTIHGKNQFEINWEGHETVVGHMHLKGGPAYIGSDYMIGHGSIQGTSQVLQMKTTMSGNINTFSNAKDEDGDGYIQSTFKKPIYVAQIMQGQDGVYYQAVPGATVSVKSASIENYLTDDFAVFVENGQQSHTLMNHAAIVNGDFSAIFSGKKNTPGAAVLTVQLLVTIPVEGGEPIEEEVEVTIAYSSFERPGSVNYTFDRPENDTVEELNEFLEQEVGPLLIGPDSENVNVAVNLADITYTGTILLPQTDEYSSLEVCGAESEDPSARGTKLIGGIIYEADSDNSNSASYRINQIHFQSPVHRQGTSVSGTGYAGIQILNCIFEGYEIGLNTEQDQMTMWLGNEGGHSFIDNAIGLKAYVMGSGLTEYEEYNFIGNGTALILTGLRDTTSYYFRITETNFINNTTDMDIRCDGTFYFYGNYFGKSLKPVTLADLYSDSILEFFLNTITGYRWPVIKPGTATVYTNPCWILPYNPNGRYINFKVGDWTKLTEIFNEDAADLLFDRSAFDVESDKKEINVATVTDQGTKRIGVWGF